MRNATFEGWGRGFLRWVAYVAPAVLVIVWMDTRYMPRAEVTTLKTAADGTHAALAVDINQMRVNQVAMLNEIGGLRDEIGDLTSQLSTLNGYLAAQSGAPFEPPSRRRK